MMRRKGGGWRRTIMRGGWCQRGLHRQASLTRIKQQLQTRKKKKRVTATKMANLLRLLLVLIIKKKNISLIIYLINKKWGEF